MNTADQQQGLTGSNSSSASDTRHTIAGRSLPQIGTWLIDSQHSNVSFSIRHTTVTNVRGRFRDFAGTVQIAEDPTQSSIAVIIQTASLDTAHPGRDADVIGVDWLDAARFPTIEFRSRNIVLDGLEGRLDGDLTLHGMTHPVTLGFEYVGIAQTPQGEERIGFVSTSSIDRRDFGIARNVPLATGGWFVSYVLHLTFDISAVKA